MTPSICPHQWGLLPSRSQSAQAAPLAWGVDRIRMVEAPGSEGPGEASQACLGPSSAIRSLADTHVPSINVPQNSSLGQSRAAGPGRPVPTGSGQRVTMYLALSIEGCWEGGQNSSRLRTHGRELGPHIPTPPYLGPCGNRRLL